MDFTQIGKRRTPFLRLSTHIVGIEIIFIKTELNVNIDVDVDVTYNIAMNKEDFFYTSMLFEKESFKEKFSVLFYETKDKVVSSVTEKIGSIGIDAVNESRKMDALRWNCEYVTVEEEMKNDINWLENRITWMESRYSNVT